MAPLGEQLFEQLRGTVDKLEARVAEHEARLRRALELIVGLLIDPEHTTCLAPTTLQYIRDLVEETTNQALHLAKGASGYYLQSLIEEDLLEGTNFRKELEDGIA
ncbi:hypothetical protein VTO58DRAFT_103273 [Aureobasidium pullulans]